nr:DeoR/GlpR family DNA-binding transcription regulator [Companilactobacillus nantensis]
MDRQDRIMQITEIIQKRKRVSTTDLATETFCSISTLRRDLIYLERQGLIRRERGEVILNTFNTMEQNILLREKQHLDEKKSLAKIARDFIGPGMCIYLDSSSTVFQLCEYIKNIDNLIVVTNSLNVANTLAANGNDTIRTFITSGEIQHNSCSVLNSEFENPIINYFNIDLAFCSASGIDQSSIYESNMNQALSKKTIMDKSKETILLIDKSKFFKTSFFKMNTLTEYKVIISDALPANPISQTVKANDIEWISSNYLH